MSIKDGIKPLHRVTDRIESLNRDTVTMGGGMPRKRSVKVEFWISKDDYLMLDAIARWEYDGNRSLALRAMIQKYYRELIERNRGGGNA
jgi:hypothetical protein